MPMANAAQFHESFWVADAAIEPVALIAFGVLFGVLRRLAVTLFGPPSPGYRRYGETIFIVAATGVVCLFFVSAVSEIYAALRSLANTADISTPDPAAPILHLVVPAAGLALVEAIKAAGEIQRHRRKTDSR